jgi:phage-related protein
MPKSLSVVSVIEKNRLSSDVPFLVGLDIDVIDPASGALVQVLRFVRNTETIIWSGFLYSPAAFDIEIKEAAGELQTVSLSFTDYTRAIQDYLQQYGGGVGFKVTVSVINAGNLAQGPEVQEFFEVIGAESADYIVSFTLGAENAISRQFPRRRQTRDFCQWQYKSVQCGYTGGLPSCDLSLKGPNGCQAHANQLRFGGFRGINTRDVRYG